MTLEIPAPPRFDLAKAVFSYGWALLAPNQWKQASTRTPPCQALHLRATLSIATRMNGRAVQAVGGSGSRCLAHFARPLHTLSGKLVNAQVSQPSELMLHLNIDHQGLHAEDSDDLKAQVKRMLRLTAEDEEAVQDFQRLHPKARKEQFGRLLRSPTAWEDLVKCILLCNCGWGRTVSMNKALCQKIGFGAFPRALDVAEADPKVLQNEAGLGYRAKSIINLAQQIVRREASLESLDDSSVTDEDLLKMLIALPGIGPFSANNMLQLLGRYNKIACDSETVRHFRDHHNKKDCSSANVEAMADKMYAKFAPYQFLAYWHEVWHCYEQLAGPFIELDPDKYGSFTGRNMTQHLKGLPKKRKRAKSA